jgi:hypothetical protein
VVKKTEGEANLWHNALNRSMDFPLFLVLASLPGTYLPRDQSALAGEDGTSACSVQEQSHLLNGEMG